MQCSQAVLRVLEFYRSEPPGVQQNLARLLMSGALGGTGRLMLLAVDQGVEHGPVRSFAAHPAGMLPATHAALAAVMGCSGHVAPLGAMQQITAGPPSLLPLVLKLNGSEGLSAPSDRRSTMLACVGDALRLGCTAVGLTLYSGSRLAHDMYTEAREVVREARAVGLPTIIWAYPRGGELTAADETAVDTVAYAAHLACQLGAHVVKAKRPSARLADPRSQEQLAGGHFNLTTLAGRVALVKASCLGGTRLLICSGGPILDDAELLAEVRDLAAGGADGLAVGRNIMLRERPAALALMQQMMALIKAGSEHL